MGADTTSTLILACSQRLLNIAKTSSGGGGIHSHTQDLRGAAMPLSPIPGAKRPADWHKGESRAPHMMGCTQHPRQLYPGHTVIPTFQHLCLGPLSPAGKKVLLASFPCEDIEAKVGMCLSGPGKRQADWDLALGYQLPDLGVGGRESLKEDVAPAFSQGPGDPSEARTLPQRSSLMTCSTRYPLPPRHPGCCRVRADPALCPETAVGVAPGSAPEPCQVTLHFQL